MHRLEAYVSLACIFIVNLMMLCMPVMFAQKKRGENIIRSFKHKT